MSMSAHPSPLALPPPPPRPPSPTPPQRRNRWTLFSTGAGLRRRRGSWCRRYCRSRRRRGGQSLVPPAPGAGEARLGVRPPSLRSCDVVPSAPLCNRVRTVLRQVVFHYLIQFNSTRLHLSTRERGLAPPNLCVRTAIPSEQPRVHPPIPCPWTASMVLFFCWRRGAAEHRRPHKRKHPTRSNPFKKTTRSCRA
jgi:hypothetical protein